MRTAVAMFFSIHTFRRCFWLITVFSGLWVLPVQGQEEASRLFFKADYHVRQAEQHRLSGDRQSALAQYQAAAREFQRLRQSYPGYSPSAVQRNLGAVQGRIQELGGRPAATRAPQPRTQPAPQRAEPVRVPDPAPAPRQTRPEPEPEPEPVPQAAPEPERATQAVTPPASQEREIPRGEPVNPAELVQSTSPRPAAGRSAAMAGASAVVNSAPRASLREPLDLIRQATPRASGTNARPAARPVDITVRTTRPAPTREEPPVVSPEVSEEPISPVAADPGRVAELQAQVQQLQQQATETGASPEPVVQVQGDEELVKRIHALREAVAEREARVVQLERELEFSRKGRNHQLETALSEKQDLEDQVAQLEAQLVQIRSAEDPSEAAEDKQNELLAETRQQLREMSTERVELLRQNSSLKEARETLQARVGALETELKDLEIAGENEALANAGSVEDSQELTLLKQQITEYQRRLDGAREEKMQNLELIVALKQKLESTDDAGSPAETVQMAALQEKVDKMSDLLTRAREEMQELQKQNQDLRLQLAAGAPADEETAAARQQLATDLQQAQQRIDELLAQNAELQKTSEQLQAGSQTAQTEQQTRLEELEKSLAQAEEKLASMAEEKVGLEDKLAARDDDDGSVLAKLQEENAALKQQLAALEQAPQSAPDEQASGMALFENSEESSSDDDPAQREDSGQKVADSVNEAVNEAIAIADSLASVEDGGSAADAESSDAEAAPQAGLAAQEDELAEDTTEVDQAFDLKNPQGLTSVFSDPMSISGDPFDSVTGKDDAALGGPLVSTSVPRPAGLNADLAKLAREATEHFQSGRFEQAEELFSELVKKDPENVYALSNLGVVRLKLQDFAGAEEVLQKAVEIDPKDAFSFETLGIVYFSQGKIDDAIEVLTMALNQDNTRWTAHNFLGIAASKKGWPEAAEKELRRAIELNPKYSDAHYNLAVLYATGQPPSLALAAKHYQRALSLGFSRSVELEQLLNRTDLAETGRTP